jgi:carbamoyl-phosphate synthase large subunit
MRLLIPTAGNRSLLLSAFREQPDVERVVTTEIDGLAPGGFYADRCYRVPRSSDPAYLPYLQEICQRENVNLLVPLADLDLVRFAKERARFERLGAKVLAAPDRTIELSMDKWQTYCLFEELGIPTPRTLVLADALARPASLQFPIYLKPRSAAMKNSPRYFFSLVQDEKELAYYAGRLEGEHSDYLLQESLLCGREINVDFFVQNGALKRLVTLYRLKAGDGGGIIRGQTIPCHPSIRESVEKLVAAVEFNGPANIQAFEMADGRMLVTEINPRFSNSSALVVRPAGVDFFALTLSMVRGVAIAPEFNNYRLLAVTTAYQALVVDKDAFSASAA